MLQVARLAPKLLSDSTDLVAAFFNERYDDCGGFRDRSGQPDLYYTVFGLEGLTALRRSARLDATRAYLASFGDGPALDFVHLACLARCWANVQADWVGAQRDRLLARLGEYRSADGGFSTEPGAPGGTAYGAFLAVGAYQDLHAHLSNPETVVRSLMSLVAADGGVSNVPEAPAGITPATAAAVLLLRHLDTAVPNTWGEWLLARAHPRGGFVATPGAPMPDLLSTATALHALVSVHVDIDGIKEPCLDFLDSLWSNRGGFYGHWEDDALDCEYTYYGLLALGHLSL